MSTRHVVVDGSNIATEGRSLPSLQQLDEAVRAFMAEFPDTQITVVVDATFGHRIDQSEVAAFDDAVANAEIVAPPAGAYGRGDAFLLRIAEKVSADVLSNDSFQEFHGEHEWLFDRGRLIGGKPVPGVGWIFTARSPVRGPKSRESVRDAKRSKSPAVKSAIRVATDEATGRSGRGRGGRRSGAKLVDNWAEVEARGKAAAVKDGLIDAASAGGENGGGRRRRRSGSSAPPSEPLNEPMVFLHFVAAHRPGATVEGVVDEFTSHGAFVKVGDARCYLPLSGMGDPAPRAARDVVKKGETRSFAVQALDPARRGVELALPEFAHVSGKPSAETVEAEINADGRSRRSRSAAKKAPAKKGTTPKAATKKAARKKTATKDAPVKKTAATKAPAKKAAAKKATTKDAPAKKAAATKAAAKTTPAKKTAAEKTSAEKTSAKKAPVKKAPAKKPTAKKAATKKVAAKKTAAKRSAPAADQE